jgi:hypothetical protein
MTKGGSWQGALQLLKTMQQEAARVAAVAAVVALGEAER